MEILFFTSLLFNRLSKVSEKCLLGIFSNFVKYSTNIFRAFFNVPGIILGPWIPMKILPLSLPPRGKQLSRKGGGRGLDITDVGRCRMEWWTSGRRWEGRLWSRAIRDLLLNQSPSGGTLDTKWPVPL